MLLQLSLCKYRLNFFMYEKYEQKSFLLQQDKTMAAWKLHLNEEQREIDRTDLANLQAKVNFRRNPRHVPPSAPPGGRTLIKDGKSKPKEIGIQRKETISV